MYCSSCGREVYDDDIFCPFCGTRLADKDDNEDREDAGVRKTGPAGKRRKKKRLTAALVAAAALAVLAFAVWKFVLPKIRKTVITPDKPAAVTAEPASAPEAAPAVTAAPSAPAPAAPAAPVQPAPATAQGLYGSGAEKPLMSDFEYYDYLRKYGIWAESEFFTDFASIMGPWKVYIVHDPYRNMNSYCEELVNIDITGSEASAEITLKWREIYFENSEIIDTSNNSDSHYYGSYSIDNGLYCTGPGNILVDRFCRYDGHEYGFGTLLSPDGVIADFFMKR